MKSRIALRLSPLVALAATAVLDGVRSSKVGKAVASNSVGTIGTYRYVYQFRN